MGVEPGNQKSGIVDGGQPLVTFYFSNLSLQTGPAWNVWVELQVCQQVQIIGHVRRVYSNGRDSGIEKRGDFNFRGCHIRF